jgi:hypothetical protein
MSDAPERWSRDAGAADIATLTIPASAQRRRVFEIDVRFVVRTAADAADPWHELTVELDGQRQWQRRIATGNLGSTDTLDYRCRADLGVGQALRVRALAKVGAAARLKLAITAEEQ